MPMDPDVVDIESPELEGVRWEALPSEPIELDPALIESLRARRKLRQITLRVGIEQIAEARRLAEATGIPYQVVMRRWLAEGASIARTVRERASLRDATKRKATGIRARRRRRAARAATRRPRAT